ncbi:MAG: hypothetical protein WCK00_12180, partial [Deltaproteobacteria bacterium]
SQFIRSKSTGLWWLNIGMRLKLTFLDSADDGWMVMKVLGKAYVTNSRHGQQQALSKSENTRGKVLMDFDDWLSLSGSWL